LLKFVLRMSYLQNISSLSSDNLGGIIDIRIVRKADVASIPAPINGAIYGDIVLKAGKSFVQWRVTLQSPKITSASKTSREGTSRTNSLGFIVPKDRREIHQMFDQASEDEFIVLYRYTNSSWKIFGLLDSPVQFEYDHDSGGNIADRNQYEGRFYYEGPDNRFFYNAEIPAPATGAAPAVVIVNGVVVASLLPGETISFDTDFDFDFQIVGT
jgi:hypothetical protein